MNVNILNYTRYTNNHTGCFAVCDVIDHFFQKYVVSMLKHGRQSTPHFTNIDLTVINGEGTLHHKSQFFPETLKLIKGPTVLINTVWDKQIMTADDWKRMNEKISFVSCRESLSANQLRNSPYKGEVIVTPDLTFYKEIEITNKPRSGVAHSDSFFPEVTRQLKRNENYKPFSSKPPIPWEQYASWLQGFELFETGRFHGLCMSIATNTPFHFLGSNCHKGRGLLADIENMTTQEYVASAKEKIEKLWQRIFLP